MQVPEERELFLTEHGEGGLLRGKDIRVVI